MFNFLIPVRRARLAELEEKIADLTRSRDRMVDDHAEERSRLMRREAELEGKLSNLERQRKHSEEDIAHLIKLKESKLDIEHQKRELERDRVKAAEIAKVKDEYRDKLELQLQRQLGDMQKMYGEILARLPNVNVRLRGDVGS